MVRNKGAAPLAGLDYALPRVRVPSKLSRLVERRHRPSLRRNVDNLVNALHGAGGREAMAIRRATIRVAVAARSAGMEPPRLLRVLKRVSRDRGLREQVSELAVNAYYGQIF